MLSCPKIHNRMVSFVASGGAGDIDHVEYSLNGMNWTTGNFFNVKDGTELTTGWWTSSALGFCPFNSCYSLKSKN